MVDYKHAQFYPLGDDKAKTPLFQGKIQLQPEDCVQGMSC